MIGMSQLSQKYRDVMDYLFVSYPGWLSQNVFYPGCALSRVRLTAPILSRTKPSNCYITTYIFASLHLTTVYIIPST
jgi:hypothetical protein